MEHRWIDNDGKIEVFGEKVVPMPLFSLQIPCGISRDGTRASVMVGGD
jgi:hypothetical protein